MMKTVLKTKPDIKSKPKMISSKIKPKAHGRYTTCIVQWRMGQNRQHYAIAEVEGKIVRWFAISINWEYEDYEMQWLEPYEMIGIDQGVTAYRPSGEKILELKILDKFLRHDNWIKIYDAKRW